MKNLLVAFAKAQGEYNPLTKDGVNPAFKSKYATLEAVQSAAFDALRKHGLVVLQSARVDWDENGKPMVVVGAALWHAESEESVAQEIALPPMQATAQGIGSAMTYGRRYVLMTLLGLAPDDDDGNSASNAPIMQGRPVSQPKPAAAAPTQNGNTPAPVAEPEPEPRQVIMTPTLKRLNIVGSEMYGEEWDAKRPLIVAAITSRHTPDKQPRTRSSKELFEDEARELIDGLIKRLADRAAVQAEPEPPLEPEPVMQSKAVLPF